MLSWFELVYCRSVEIVDCSLSPTQTDLSQDSPCDTVCLL